MNTIQTGDTDKILETLKERIRLSGHKPKSRKAMEMGVNFLAGAAAAINVLIPSTDPEQLSKAIPPIWMIAPMCGRSVLQDFL